MSTGKYLSKLRGSRVLIFGATSGIGFAVAQASFEYGATIIITGSRQSKLDQTTTRLLAGSRASPDNIVSHICDLSNKDTLEANLIALLEAATDGKKKKLNHIVFTAGDALPMKPLAEVDPEYIQVAGLVRFIAPLMLGKLIPGYMNASPDCSFTITSGYIATKPAPGVRDIFFSYSSLDFMPSFIFLNFVLLLPDNMLTLPQWAIVAAYSGAQEALTRALAVDLAPIRVNCVSPGSVQTELLSGLPESAAEYMRQKTLIKRLGRPEDMAEAYLYAMKDGFVTGSVLHSNGGALLA